MKQFVRNLLIIVLFCLFSADVNFDELSRCTDDFNGAMLKAVCVEAVSSLNFPSFDFGEFNKCVEEKIEK